MAQTFNGSDRKSFESHDAAMVAGMSNDATLDSLSDGELGVLQDVTFGQLRETNGDPTGMLLLGRVWSRLDRESRRRKNAIGELDRMYFAR